MGTAFSAFAKPPACISFQNTSDDTESFIPAPGAYGHMCIMEDSHEPRPNEESSTPSISGPGN
jgi:hypothetical protein